MELSNKVNTSQAKQDCYFYYYSSCTKGDSCPFRHEPASLKNETMCKYWLQGSCNKSNCIFRHMQINVDRSNIACYHESQPGGCRKVHCPFMHADVLNHPREEDLKKQPDIILPVKTGANAEFENQLREVISSAKNSRQLSLSSALSARATQACIVSLHDDDSDVEASPLKKSVSIVPTDEVEKLAEIIKAESSIVGYDHNEMAAMPYEYMYDRNDDENDAVHRRIQLMDDGIRITKRQSFEPMPSKAAHYCFARRRHSPEKTHPNISVSLKALVSVNGQVHDEGAVRANGAGTSVKSRLGKYSPVKQTGSEQLRNRPSNIKHRLNIPSDHIHPSSMSATVTPPNSDGEAARSVKSRLSSKSARDTQTHFGSLDVNVKPARSDAKLADFQIKSLKQIKAQKRPLPESAIDSCMSKRTSTCRSNASFTTKRKHRPIVFDAGSSSVQITVKTRQPSSRSITKAVRDKATTTPPPNRSTQPTAKVDSSNRSLSQLSDSVLEENLLLDESGFDFEDEEVDEDLLLS